ncbi:hypothetical protein AUK40_05525 [Candidatus Wirthbacteria bacterium CG2_30_54_11]|uniref:NTP pyrophosphohydrolase MazG-like domain-containing protein n=1 Tax=Candidatus Wirthbacteria bacterium CG2_30_54_11 TaxID=1817892 RepID=A0A1J5IFV3_9BACT|nr:MAG: hypothetical protein AUK40_05525 [Candidatus Wirthbacteria bacterium CG2_30_54_11]
MTKKTARVEQLLELANQLRSPGGCPWDQKQTLKDMSGFVQKEAVELDEAIDEQDSAHICEELGDVLFNLCLIASIAEEQGQFTLAEVVAKTTAKIKTRHTWVFGEDKVNSSEEAIALWKLNKQRERGQK